MQKLFAVTLAAALVGGPVSAADDAPVSLKLICPGTEQITEVSHGSTGRWVDGEYQRGSMMIQTPGTQVGNLKIAIEGNGGVLEYPSGPKRSFDVIEIDERHIVGKYKHMLISRTIRIDRMTGEIRIKDAFDGTCAPAPQTTTPKF